MLAGSIVAATIFLTSAHNQRSPVAAVSPTPTVTASPGSAQLKPPLGGLLTRNGPPPETYISVMGGYVVTAYWRDLQPTRNGDIAVNNVIDQAIDSVRQLDPSGTLGLKVRVYAGIDAPDWAKSLGGAPIAVIDPSSGVSGTVGRFWSSEFGSAYSDLQARLAARYDSVPEIREVTISQCTTVYAEPFIRDEASVDTVSGLLAAGFTVAADKQCLVDEITAHRVWLRTRSDLAFNPYQVIDGSTRTDEALTEQMMDLCRSTLGARCVLENNSLRVPPQYPDMYSHMHSLGPPIAFQTASIRRVGDLEATLESAIQLGAGSVELPTGFEVIPESTLGAYNARLKAVDQRLPASSPS